MAITLSDLKGMVRARSDTVGSLFNEDGLTSFINAGYLGLYDLLISTKENFRQEQFDFQVSASDDGYEVPVSVYHFKGLDYISDPNHPKTIHSFEWQERNQVYNCDFVRYNYTGNKILFRPLNTAQGTFRAYYIPDLTLLSEATDAIFPEFEKWHTYIVVDAAIRLLDSEESDTSALQRELGTITSSIRGFAKSRDAGGPKRIADTEGFGMRWLWDRTPYRRFP